MPRFEESYSPPKTNPKDVYRPPKTNPKDVYQPPRSEPTLAAKLAGGLSEFFKPPSMQTPARTATPEAPQPTPPTRQAQIASPNINLPAQRIDQYRSYAEAAQARPLAEREKELKERCQGMTAVELNVELNMVRLATLEQAELSSTAEDAHVRELARSLLKYSLEEQELIRRVIAERQLQAQPQAPWRQATPVIEPPRRSDQPLSAQPSDARLSQAPNVPLSRAPNVLIHAPRGPEPAPPTPGVPDINLASSQVRADVRQGMLLRQFPPPAEPALRPAQPATPSRVEQLTAGAKGLAQQLGQRFNLRRRPAPSVAGEPASAATEPAQVGSSAPASEVPLVQARPESTPAVPPQPARQPEAPRATLPEAPTLLQQPDPFVNLMEEGVRQEAERAQQAGAHSADNPTLEQFLDFFKRAKIKELEGITGQVTKVEYRPTQYSPAGLGKWIAQSSAMETVFPTKPGRWVLEPQPGSKLAIKISRGTGRANAQLSSERAILLGVESAFGEDFAVRPAKLRGYGVNENGRPYLALEWIGDDFQILESYINLNKSTRNSEPLPEKEAVEIALKMSLFLQRFHQADFVHNDIGNILVNSYWDPGTKRLRIIDFGNAFNEKLEPQGASFSSDRVQLGRLLFRLVTGRDFPGHDKITPADWAMMSPATRKVIEKACYLLPQGQNYSPQGKDPTSEMYADLNGALNLLRQTQALPAEQPRPTPQPLESRPAEPIRYTRPWQEEFGPGDLIGFGGSATSWGGEGGVFRPEQHPNLAIKVFRQQEWEDAHRELSALLKLQGLDHVAPLLGYRYMAQEPNNYLVKEFIEGENLERDIIDLSLPIKRGTETFTVQQKAAAWLVSSMEALAQIHARKFLVGDFKYSDYLWDPHRQSTVIIDFGNAIDTSAASYTRAVSERNDINPLVNTFLFGTFIGGRLRMSGPDMITHDCPRWLDLDPARTKYSSIPNPTSESPDKIVQTRLREISDELARIGGLPSLKRVLDLYLEDNNTIDYSARKEHSAAEYAQAMKGYFAEVGLYP